MITSTVAADARAPKENTKSIAKIKICNASDYQAAARSILPKPLYEYLASGTDDEQTLSENDAAFKHWYLRPRVMRPVGSISTATTLFGQKLSLPVFISPAGVHALCDTVHGECASARAAQRVGTLFGLSQHATRSIEQVANACSPQESNLWYQSYILKDREMTLRLVRRAANAGYKGIFLTVDSVRFGFREADARNGWNAIPEPHRLVNYDEEIAHKQIDKAKFYSGDEDAWDQNTEQLFEQNATWDDVRWLKREACHDLPLIIKGIMTVEDAVEAVRAGADGVVVSNHGGRGLDGALAAIDALPDIVASVGDKVPVLMDGGIRRGTDVLKALALGATAVGIGKPVFFALAVGGENAVVNLLHLLQKEVEAAMAICGVANVADAKKMSLVTRHPNGIVIRYTRSKL
jgi:isopentenyl diphosphate isomerase/L-lactate dehydrogenase-like FMN-dependent dehydrogenase